MATSKAIASINMHVVSLNHQSFLSLCMIVHCFMHTDVVFFFFKGSYFLIFAFLLQSLLFDCGFKSSDWLILAHSVLSENNQAKKPQYLQYFITVLEIKIKARNSLNSCSKETGLKFQWPNQHSCVKKVSLYSRVVKKWKQDRTISFEFHCVI